MDPHSLSQGLSKLAPRPVVAEQLVAARLLHGRGERPRSDDLGLEGAADVLGQLLDGVEILCQERLRAAVVGAAGVGQSPARGLQVGGEPCHHRQAATGHRGVDPAAGDLGDVRQVGQLAQHDAYGLGVVALLRPGERPDSCRPAHAPTLRVASMVADPTTREPS